MLMERAATSTEVKRRVFNCIRIPRGNFVYNKDIGSGLYTLDLKRDNYKEQARLLVEEAMLCVPHTECTNVDIEIYDAGYKLIVAFAYKGESNVIEVMMNG